VKYYHTDLREIITTYSSKALLAELPPLEFRKDGMFSQALGMESASAYIDCDETHIDWEDTVDQFCQTVALARQEQHIYQL
jgi:hypothetical protein